MINTALEGNSLIFPGFHDCEFNQSVDLATASFYQNANKKSINGSFRSSNYNNHT